MDTQLVYFLKQHPNTVQQLARLLGKSGSGIRKTLTANSDVVLCRKNAAGENTYWIAPEDGSKPQESSMPEEVGHPLAEDQSPLLGPALASAETRGRKSEWAGKTLTALCSDNPRRAGTHGHKSLGIILASPGITAEDFLAEGGRLNDLRWDHSAGRVKAE